MISIVLTVLDESKNIVNLLDSLTDQTFKFNELLIVDGGSKDGTRNIIKKYIRQNKINNIFYYYKTGNISVGRNHAIRKAKGDIVVIIDAGCVAEKDWLRQITMPFRDKKVDVVAGFYTIVAKTNLQKALAPYCGVHIKRLDVKTFLPSARSLALRKSVWAEIGGFPENLTLAGEDTLFNYLLVQSGARIFRNPRAIVNWEAPKNIWSFSKKVRNYALGDIETGIWWHPILKFKTHNIKAMTIIARYALFSLQLLLSFAHHVFLISFVATFLSYLLWSIWKNRDIVDDSKARAFLPLVQIVSDFSVMTGFLAGIGRIIGKYVIQKQPD